MGAADDYSEKVKEEIEIQKALIETIEEQDKKEIENAVPVVYSNLTKKIFNISYIACGVLLVTIIGIAISTFNGNMKIDVFKKLSFQFTIVYFIISAITTCMKMKAERVVVK